MKTPSISVPLACILLAVTLRAQSNGYLFIAPGGVTSQQHTSGALYLGGGGEAISRIGLGGGAELGYATPWSSFRGGLGVASANASYHFNRRGRLVPFVTGGYTLFFRSGHENGMNVGGGLNWWFARRAGVRLELRDHAGLGSLSEAHLWSVRVGIAFR